MAVNCMSIEKTKEGYMFQVNAPQNHNQPLGISAVHFTDYAECKRAMEMFASLVRRNSMQVEDGKFVKIEKKDGKYYFNYYNDGGNLIFRREKGYCQKTGCKKGIYAVFKIVNRSV